MTPVQKNPKDPNRFRGILSLAVAIWAGLWLVVNQFLPRLVGWTHHAKAASIGIIGGADGPTAIFITSHPANLWGILVPAVLLAIGIIGYIHFRHNQHNKKGEA